MLPRRGPLFTVPVPSQDMSPKGLGPTQVWGSVG